jgi:vacuolar-type H+-ATPase subunit I/STV1
MEDAKKLSPGYGGINDSIVQLSVDKQNLIKKITELENKHNNLLNEMSKNNNNLEELTKYKNDINIKDKEIKKLKEEIEELNNSKNVSMKSEKDNNNNKIMFKNSKEFKKILSDFEKKIKKSRNDFCEELSKELAELQIKHKNKEDEYDVLVVEKNKLLKNVEYLSGRKLEPNSYEEVLREQTELMRQTFLEKIDDLNDELINIKQDSRMKIYRMEEEIKEKNELKDTFLNQVISLQEKLEIK